MNARGDPRGQPVFAVHRYHRAIAAEPLRCC